MTRVELDLEMKSHFTTSMWREMFYKSVIQLFIKLNLCNYNLPEMDLLDSMRHTLKKQMQNRTCGAMANVMA